MTNLAIFDLDNTLLADDSDYVWGNFLVAKGLVDAEYYQRENDRFYQEYKDKTLDIYEYQRFVLKPLSQFDSAQLDQLHIEFMAEYISPIYQEKANALIAKHRDAGDTLLVITATNRFITEPIVKALGIDNLLATDPEVVDGKFTGNIVGDPCFQEGKIRRLDLWLEQQECVYEHSTFYSDSINDAPLLHHADKAIAVDPDKALHELATSEGWPIISLRN